MYFTVFIRQMVDLVFVVGKSLVFFFSLPLSPLFRLFFCSVCHRIHCCLCEKFTFVGVTRVPLCSVAVDRVLCEQVRLYTCVQWRMDGYLMGAHNFHGEDHTRTFHYYYSRTFTRCRSCKAELSTVADGSVSISAF